jgi:hypothetical protein
LLFAFAFLLFTFALFAPFTIIAPAYALPQRLTDDAGVPNHLGITFEQAELVGYALPQKAVKPGDELPLTIFWRARERISEDFSVYIRLLEADGTSIGRWEAFPGNGLYPTRVWQPGEIVRDDYRVPVSLDARAPSVARIEVGLFRRVPLESLTARDPHGNVITPTVARFKVAGQANVQVENPVNYRFGDSIALVGSTIAKQIKPGETLKVKLFWRALRPIDEDYTVFVHFVDANGNRIAQQDNQPQRDTYPTSFWDAGEIIDDEYALALPRDTVPGDYKIVIGLYRSDTRLPVQGGDALDLATVRVAK